MDVNLSAAIILNGLLCAGEVTLKDSDEAIYAKVSRLCRVIGPRQVSQLNRQETAVGTPADDSGRQA